MNNNRYRTIFSKRLGMLVPVAEAAKANGKSSGIARERGSNAASPLAESSVPGRWKTGSLLVLAVTAFWNGAALADSLPTGGVVTGGTGSINQNGSTLTVNQSSQYLSADWQSFNIGANHTVRFNQPNSSSLALNRIIGTEASSIYGNLQANGQVFLINPNGILFAPGSQINVGGLAASTLNISEADFAAGRYRLSQGAGAGSVVNEGQINAGSVVFIAPQIINNGTISTPGGRTTFAAGDQVTVSMLDGLLSAQVDVSVAEAEIQNHGQILANGGRVDLIAGRADSVLNSLINTDGVIRAQGVREENGRIFLDSGAGGTVKVSGTLDASAPDADQGGKVRVLGDTVTLADGAHVDVSGQREGGTVLIGGDFQGKNPEVLNASRTTVEQGAVIKADGGEQGGRVIVWSNDTTRYAGSISAQGKGFVEVSGKGTLNFSGSVDTGGGTLLLDPTDITVQSADGDQNNTFGTGQLRTLLFSNDVILAADNDITWNSGAALDYNGTGNKTLTLQAGDGISYSGTISDSVAGGDSLNVIFNADRDASGAGAITINNGATIATSGGDIVLRGGSGALTALPAFTDAGYEAALRATAARNVTVTGATLDAAGGNIVMRGVGLDSGTSVGVSLLSSTVQTNGSGTIAMDGIGGAGSGGYNRGVQLISSAISTVDGQLSVQGTGAGTGSENSGIRVNTGTTIRATGSGDLVINAVGSTGGNFNDGIVLDRDSRMSVADGDMTVTGTGRGTGIGSDGIELANTSIVEATGTGNVTLNGTSTATGANTNRGVTVWLGSTARTSSGELTLQGSSSDPAKGAAISLEGVTIGGATQSGAVTLQTGGSVLLATSTIDTGGALSITGGSYTTTGASTLKSNTLAFGNTNTITDNGTLTFNQTADATIANAIAGTGSIVKNGANTLTLTSNNTYSGGTTINTGILQMGAGGTTGTLGSGAVNINAAGTLQLFRREAHLTFANAVSGTGTWSLLGTGGTLQSDYIPSGNNSGFTGSVVLDKARFTFDNPNDLGAAARVTVLEGGQVYIIGATMSNDMVLNGNGWLETAGTNRLGAIRLQSNAVASGDITLQSDASISAYGSSGTISGDISGNANLSKTNTGTVILTGDNTYTGTTTVSTGTLQVGNGGTSGTLGSGAVTNNGSLVFNRSDALTVGNVIGGTGSVSQIGSGTTIFTGDNIYSGSTTISAGTLQVGANGTTGTLGSGSVVNNSLLVFNRSDSTDLATLANGGITGTGNVTALIGGSLDVNRDIALTGTNSTILLEAGKDVAAGTATGGDVTLTNNISTSATGTVTIFSGNANTAALDAKVSGAAGSTRFKTYNADAADTNGAVAGTRNYYYRQTPDTISVTGLTATKTYDGLADAKAVIDDSAAVVTGLIDGDMLAYGDLGLLTATFDSADAGSRSISASYSRPGEMSYTSGGATWSVSGHSTSNLAGMGTGTITPASLTVKANNDAKIVTQADMAGYNGVSFTGFVNGESAANLDGALAITRTNAGTDAAGNYVGVLQPGGYTSGNYTITYATGDYRIIPAEQLLVRIQNVNNVYGTTPGYAITSAQYLGADGVTFYNLTQTAHNGNTYTYTDTAGGSVTFTVTPQDAVTSSGGHLAVGNYTLAGSNVTTGGSNFNSLHYVGNQSVNRAALTPLASGVSKVYDGTTDMTGLTLGLNGLMTGDAVNASGTGAFASRNAGTGLTYYVDGLALAGADAANYYLTSGSLSGNDGVITPRQLTVTAIPASKVYDGTLSAPGTPTVTGSLVTGDSFSLLAQEFASPNVGTNLTLIPLAAIDDGNGGANYALTLVNNNMGIITAAPEEVTTPAVDITLLGGTNAAATLNNDNPDSRNNDSAVRCFHGNDQENCNAYGDAVYRIVATGLKLPQGLEKPLEVDSSYQQ